MELFFVHNVWSRKFVGIRKIQLKICNVIFEIYLYSYEIKENAETYNKVPTKHPKITRFSLKINILITHYHN